MPAGYKRGKLTSAERFDEIIKFIEYKEDVLEAVKAHTKQTAEPFMLIGLHKEIPFRFYLSVYDHAYSFESFSDCLDLLLKSYFVFNVNYPKSVSNIYMFLQHFGYRIYSEKDLKINSVLQFIGKHDKTRLPNENKM